MDFFFFFAVISTFSFTESSFESHFSFVFSQPLKRLFIYLFVCLCFMYGQFVLTYEVATHAYSTFRSQKRALDPLELERQMVVSNLVGAGKPSLVLCKSNQCFCSRSPLSSAKLTFVFRDLCFRGPFFHGYEAVCEWEQFSGRYFLLDLAGHPLITWYQEDAEVLEEGDRQVPSSLPGESPVGRTVVEWTMVCVFLLLLSSLHPSPHTSPVFIQKNYPRAV